MRASGGAEVADIFRQYGLEYRRSHQLPRRQLRVMGAIEDCRTSALGGHKDKCDNCGHIEINYNSCRNRHCPKCQFLKKEKWIEARAEDVLPIRYFHVVFTVPAELRPLALSNQKVMYNILFRSVSETLIRLGNDPKHLGARIGFMAILHTWGQNLMDHPHIHCVVPSGGLSHDGSRWISSRKKFFISVDVMSDLFKKKVSAYLKSSYESGELVFPGIISHFKERHAFERLRVNLYHKKWVVYCKPPFNPKNAFTCR
jgi:Transposase zinc-binding domain/Putative transposase